MPFSGNINWTKTETIFNSVGCNLPDTHYAYPDIKPLIHCPNLCHYASGVSSGRFACRCASATKHCTNSNWRYCAGNKESKIGECFYLVCRFLKFEGLKTTQLHLPKAPASEVKP
jgi:hypothetical protein